MHCNIRHKMYHFDCNNVFTVLLFFIRKKEKIPCRAISIAGKVLSFPPLDHVCIWICGVPVCCLHYGWWRLKTHTLTGNVLLMLNSSSPSFKLARFYSNLERFNRWIILSLRYIMQDSNVYILSIGCKNEI
jgi:hypothetical protein